MKFQAILPGAKTYTYNDRNRAAALVAKRGGWVAPVSARPTFYGCECSRPTCGGCDDVMDARRDAALVDGRRQGWKYVR